MHKVRSRKCCKEQAEQDGDTFQRMGWGGLGEEN